MREARRVPFPSASGSIAVPAHLDTLSLLIFVALFGATLLLTARRPASGAAILLVTGPFELARSVAGTDITLPKVALLAAICGLIAYGAGTRVLRGKGLTGVAIAAGCIAVSCALSGIDALYPGPLVRETLKAFERLALIVTCYACYRLDPDDVLLLRSLALTTCGVFLSAIVDVLTGASSLLVIHGRLIPRLTGVLEGPNQLAAFLELAACVLAAAVARRYRLWSAILLAVAACFVVLTFSRAGAAGVLVAAAVCAFGAPGALVPLAAACLPILVAGGVAIARLQDVPVDTGGVGSRGELWNAALAMFRAHPLLGIGAGNYELRLDDYGVHGVRTHANNLYLQALAEGGLATFAATCALFVTATRALSYKLRTAPLWQLAALAAAIVMAVHGLFDDVLFYQKVGTPFAVLLGIGLAARDGRA